MLDIGEIKIVNCTFPMNGFYLNGAKATSFVMKDCTPNQEITATSFGDCEIDNVVIENSVLSSVWVHGVSEIAGSGGIYSTGAKFNLWFLIMWVLVVDYSLIVKRWICRFFDNTELY